MQQYVADRKKGLVGAHFMKIVRKLKQFHKQFSTEMKKAFPVKTHILLSLRGIWMRYLKPLEQGRQLQGRVTPRCKKRLSSEKTSCRVVEKQQPGFANAIVRQVQKIIRSDGFTPIYNFMFTADSRLRKIGSDKLADLFYTRAQDGKAKGRKQDGLFEEGYA